MQKLKELASLPGGLRAKFIAASACMTILPFLVCLYIVTAFVFPVAESMWLTSSIILVTMLISYCGFYIMQDVVGSIISLSGEARRLAAHRGYDAAIHEEGDELAVIRHSLSTLAQDVERVTLKVRQMELRDEKIGICTERHLRDILAEELKRACLHKRPCSLLLARFGGGVDVDAILKDEAHNFMALSALAGVMKRFATGIEKIGRIGASGICLVLPEYTRQQALEMASRIKVETEALHWNGLSALADWCPEVFLTVACAPVDGVDSSVLLQKCLASDPAVR